MAKKGSSTIRVMAVKRPPANNDIAEEYLRISPFITQEQLTEWLGMESEDTDSNEDLTPEQYAETGFTIMAKLAEGVDLKALQFLFIMQSELHSQMFDGVYAPTKGNAIFPIEAFLDSRRLGLYPPDWVLEWLAKAFDEYIKSEGDEDLSKLLGAKRGKGQTQIFKEYKAVMAESQLMQEMGILTTAGATIAEAAEMVSARQEETDPDCLTPDTLAERYSKKGWSKIFKPVKAMSPTVSLDDVKKAFAAYPQLSVPTRFRQTD